MNLGTGRTRFLICAAVAHLAALPLAGRAGYTNGPDPHGKPPPSCCTGSGGSSGGPGGGAAWGTAGLGAAGSAEGPDPGMPTASVNPNLIGLVINDRPLSYRTPVGPDVEINVTYNQKDTDQPATFTYSNLGRGWTMNWIEYIQDDPNAPGSNVMLYLPDGQGRAYAGFDASTNRFAPEPQSGARLVKINSSPLSYERRLPDGSVEVFGRPDGNTTYPRRIFLTARVDPAGNAVTLQYDDSGRLSSIRDAVGQVSRVEYANAQSPLLITAVVDPFGRRATFGYDATGRLMSLTDAIGMTSTVTYAPENRVDSLSTPYGKTTFAYVENGYNYAMEVTDPLGHASRYEFNQGTPGIPFSESAVPAGMPTFNNYINGRNSYFWDAQMLLEGRGDYTKARIFHWEHRGNLELVTSDVLESVKYPLENRIWNNYPGGVAGGTGILDRPAFTGRVAPDGSTQLTTNTYNGFGKLTRSVDPTGLVTTTLYASNDIDPLSIRKERSGFSSVETFVWNNQHRPLSHTDPNGHTTAYGYNAAGQIVSERDALGHETRWTYDSRGFLLTETDRNGKVTTLTYDAVGRVASKTDPANAKTSYRYDNLDRVVRIDYWDGSFETRTYDKLDVVERRDRSGATSRFTFDAARNMLTATDAEGGLTRFAYYPNNLLKSVTDAVGLTTSWVRDLEGRVVKRVAPDGGETRYAYDENNRLVQATDALDHVTLRATYDPMGRLKSETDANGVVTEYTYHPMGWPQTSTVRAPGGGHASGGDATMSFTYDAKGNVLSLTDADGVTQRFAYDADDRLISKTDVLGGTVAYVLDNEGNRLSDTTSRAPGGVATRKVSRLFNAVNLPTDILDAQGRADHVAFDGDRRPTSETDARGYLTRRAFDPMGRLLSIERTASGKSQFQYDGRGRLRTFTDAMSLSTAYTFDPLGRIVRTNSPDRGENTAAYDTAGRLGRTTDARGISVSHTYDKLDRILSSTYADASRNITYRYDLPDATTGCTASYPMGRLGMAMDPEGATTYCYDHRGNVVSAIRVAAGSRDVTSYTYTAADRVASITYPSGNVVSYGYDANGRTRDVSLRAKGASADRIIVGNASYLPFGPIEHYELGGTQALDRTYDQNYWLTAIKSPVLHLTFSRVADGLAESVVDDTGADKLGYDASRRLAVAGLRSPVATFQYNLGGDRTNQGGAGANQGAYIYLPGTHRLASAGGVARTYDASGNTTSLAVAGQALSITYDADGQADLVSRGTQDVANYGYDFLGQRVSKTTLVPAAAQRRFVYDQSRRLLAEYGDGNRDYIWLGDELPVATVDGSTSPTISFIHADGLGSPRAVTDASGTRIWWWPLVGNPFGEVQPQSSAYLLNLRFPGQYYDEESGLAHNDFRVYDASSGRYLQSDPIGLRGGLNTYGYAYANPYDLFDPLGLSTDCQRLATFGGSEYEELVGSTLVDSRNELLSVHADPNISVPRLKPDQMVRNIARIANGVRKNAKDLYLVSCTAHVVKTYNDEYDTFRNFRFVDLCVDDLDCGRKSVRLSTGSATEPLGRKTRERPELGDVFTVQFLGDFPEVECMEWLRGLQ